ncbi:hypothetical protein FQZ97_839230 [compost metagenome]
MAGRARQRHGGVLAARGRYRARGVDGTGGAGKRGLPGAGGQRTAAVERKQPDARREIGGFDIVAKTAYRPDRRKHVEPGVGRVERDPFLPGAGEEIHVARRMHALDQGDVRRRWGAQVPDAALPQRLQHVLQARWCFVAGDQLAAEHLLPAGMFLVDGVVEDLHGVRVLGGSG